MNVSFFHSVSVFEVHWFKLSIQKHMWSFIYFNYLHCNFSLVEFKNSLDSLFWFFFPVNLSNSVSHSLSCCILPSCRVCVCVCVFMMPYVGCVTGHMMLGIRILLRCLERFCIIKFILNVWINLSLRLIILYTEFYQTYHIFMYVGKR